ncbi:putative transketolase [Coleophoma cylindrospora]|uniref:Putative transketolase n=1 Tax=Coleophoma cylindrospora TaxID=1849047 RepID=A0A3D8QNS4_9HELO|nr:putative transketolase [Coleophoma cylindrospora]
MASATADFGIDVFAKYKPVSLDPANPTLSEQAKSDLLANISLLRDTIVYFTASGAARGVSGHTGGPYDTIPEVCILLAFFEHSVEKFVPIVYDESGHRVATQYLLSALHKHIPFEHLLHYREANSKLPGHPELGLTPGIQFSSGRLGHLWAFVNGVCLANPEKTVFLLGSDGSQQEGDDAEAARLAVAQGLNIKLLIDDNDVTIAGHPSEYLKGYSLGSTLSGHGLKVFETAGEDIDQLYASICGAIAYPGPAAVISKRKMAPGIKGLEGTTHAHDVIPVKIAVEYLEERGYNEAAAKLKAITPNSLAYLYSGSSTEKFANRVIFGEAVVTVLEALSKEEAKKRVLVVDSDLEGSTGLSVIHKKRPEVFLSSGIMERGNFSAAAGFGSTKDKVGVFSTFSAFCEMIISELTMARLNFANVLCHFSHSGVDEMADNTCHFGLNTFFADNALIDGDTTRIYFPADANQMRACVSKVFWDQGIRLVLSTRAKCPLIYKENSQDPYYEEGYEFTPSKDEFIRVGTAGYVVAFGEMVYRALDAVDRLRSEGVDVGLVNKSTLNVVDEEAIKKFGSSPFVLVVESLNQKTGLGSKMGTWLLERQLTPKYKYIGTTKEGCGGLGEQIFHQGLDPQSVVKAIRSLQ